MKEEDVVVEEVHVRVSELTSSEKESFEVLNQTMKSVCLLYKFRIDL